MKYRKSLKHLPSGTDSLTFERRTRQDTLEDIKCPMKGEPFQRVQIQIQTQCSSLYSFSGCLKDEQVSLFNQMYTYTEETY